MNSSDKVNDIQKGNRYQKKIRNLMINLKAILNYFIIF